MRRLTIKKARRKSKKVIIISALCLIFIMSVGYAAFQTNLSITAKGNIYNKGDLCYETSDNGDGTVTITNYDKTCGSNVIIPETIKGKTVTKIGATDHISLKSFAGKGLTSVVIPDTVSYIGVFAFYRNKINSLDLGNGVVEIRGEAFHGNELTTVVFPKSLQEIGEGVFMNNYLTEIPPLDNISYGNGAFSFNNLNPSEAFIYSKNEDGSIDYTTLNSYAARKWVDTIEVPSTVKRLAYYSLRYANSRAITLPEGLEYISTAAIMQINSTILNLPSTIKTISETAFRSSPNIKTININLEENAITGSPWGATNAEVIWKNN